MSVCQFKSSQDPAQIFLEIEIGHVATCLKKTKLQHTFIYLVLTSFSRNKANVHFF